MQARNEMQDAPKTKSELLLMKAQVVEWQITRNLHARG